MSGLGAAGLVRLLDEHRQLRAGLRSALHELDRFHAGLEDLVGGASLGGTDHGVVSFPHRTAQDVSAAWSGGAAKDAALGRGTYVKIKSK